MTLFFFKRLAFLFLGLGLAGLGFGYCQIRNRLNRPEVLHFVEKKAGEILSADIKIGKLNYLPPFAVSLQDIQLHQRSASPSFSVASVKKLVFSYGLLNLIRGDFTIPSSFELHSPSIHFISNRLPLPFLDGTFSSSHPSEHIPSKLVIKKGEFHYQWGQGKEIILSGVRFQAKPNVGGQIELKLAAKIQGVAKGKIKMHGITDAQFNRYQLRVDLDGVSFLEESHVPVHELSGHFQISEKNVEIFGMSSLFHDWELAGMGKIDDWQSQPKIFMEMERKKEGPPFKLSLEMDFKSRKMSGDWFWAGRSYPFHGDLGQQDRKIIFSRLSLAQGYLGKGEIDPTNGDYDFSLERNRRRIRIHSSLSRMDFQTEFRLDHVSLNRLDWSVAGSAHFSPLPKRPGEPGPRFHADVKTDYLVIEYEPFEDFKGSFELSPEGIQAIDGRWNKVFHLEGGILFRGGKAREDLVLHVEEFPLKTIEEFAARPLPSNLSGRLEGKLKLRGEPGHPEVQGYFTIRDGTMEKLDFDCAIIQFQGYPPYLKIYDSNIMRGRTTLKMTGAIDLTLPNIFHGIQIRGPDHLVIWKGMSVYWKEGKSAIEGEKPLGQKVAMGFEVDSGSKREDPEDNQALVGPKFKF